MYDVSSSPERLSALSLSVSLKKDLSPKKLHGRSFTSLSLLLKKKKKESGWGLGRHWKEDDGGLGSAFILPWRWEKTTFDRNRDFMK